MQNGRTGRKALALLLAMLMLLSLLPVSALAGDLFEEEPSVEEPVEEQLFEEQPQQEEAQEEIIEEAPAEQQEEQPAYEEEAPAEEPQPVEAAPAAAPEAAEAPAEVTESMELSMSDSEKYEDGSTIRYFKWEDNDFIEAKIDAGPVNYLVGNTTSYADNTLSTEGWYLLNDTEITYLGRIILPKEATVNIILQNGRTLNANKGITVPENSTLNIYAQSLNSDAGNLCVSGSNSSYAGIGGDNSDSNYVVNCGKINIHGGNITVKGGDFAAGIGGTNGIINIYGGTVNATGGQYGAGIGGASEGAGGTINITGGTVTATGGVGNGSDQWGGAGIGGGGGNQGAGGNGGTITISGGTVTATGQDGGAGIGGGGRSDVGDHGRGGDGGTVTISGGTVTATGNDGGVGIGGGTSGENGTLKVVASHTVYSNDTVINDETKYNATAMAQGKGTTETDEEVTIERMPYMLVNAGMLPAFKTEAAHTILLSDSISVLFGVAFPDGFDTSICKVSFSYNAVTDGRGTVEVPFSESRTIDGYGGHFFPAIINPMELAETITATLKVNNAVVDTDTFSAMTYISAQSNSSNAKLATLVKALQDYGHYMQQSGWSDELGKTHTTINKINDVDVAAAAAALNSASPEYKITGTTTGMQNLRIALGLNDQTVIIVAFQPADGYSSVSGTYDSVKYGDETYWQFSSAKLKPTQLGVSQPFSFTITGSGVDTVTPSLQIPVMGYVKSMLNNPNIPDVQKQAMAAYYNYYAAVMAYQSNT